MYVDGDLGKGFTGPLIMVEWLPRQLTQGGFEHETYACGEERCDRYRARQQGAEMVLSYDETGLLVEMQVSGPEGGGTVRYEYGPVEASAPANAVPAPAPIPFLGPTMPIPSLP